MTMKCASMNAQMGREFGDGYYVMIGSSDDVQSELFISEGTMEGMTLLKDINVNGSAAIKIDTVIGDKLYFSSISDGYFT